MYRTVHCARRRVDGSHHAGHCPIQQCSEGDVCKWPILLKNSVPAAAGQRNGDRNQGFVFTWPMRIAGDFGAP
jgi:hypothetical protein